MILLFCIIWGEGKIPPTTPVYYVTLSDHYNNIANDHITNLAKQGRLSTSDPQPHAASYTALMPNIFVKMTAL